MKKIIKIVLLIILCIILLIIIDLTFIFTKSRPLFAVEEPSKLVYRGIFYDTYNCHEYSVSQIKRKGTKIKCTVLD